MANEAPSVTVLCDKLGVLGGCAWPSGRHLAAKVNSMCNMMTSNEIRSAFLKYYEQHEHLLKASASLVPSSYDPSVLLTTAGMQPFKPFFLGQEQPDAKRYTSCQKCFRTPDIDQVGLTARHLTFFEMLGNFSFGDYFKHGAIKMAWQVVTEVFGMDPDSLWVTVHEGDAALGLGEDSEAIDLWLQSGVPAERIVRLGEDNFWKAGPTGPCGPCSEIYFDRGSAYGCGSADCRPGCECDRYLEFYNLVFMQYDRDSDGALHPLPAKNIDTGMGLERLAALLQGNVSVFEIDTMRSIMEWVETAANVTYGSDEYTTKALRVLADHGRSMTFLASDGVSPSNEGRGYVLRRIIRRAIQHAERIGLYDDSRDGILEGLSGRVVEIFGDSYPELALQRATVIDILGAEEERFLRTLRKGSGMWHEILEAGGGASAPGQGDASPVGNKTGSLKVISGDDAFKLHDTYGFPVELTAELAREAGFEVDIDRFNELMREQRERARSAAGSGSLPTQEAAEFVRTCKESRFVGYDELQVETTIEGLQPVGGEDHSGRFLIKLAESPFYAEGGGQVSDTGTISGKAGRASVVHVLRFESDQVIVADVDGSLTAGESVQAAVNGDERCATESNHTATHLLHKALRGRLGDHVRQAGSLVQPNRLRFDFTHPTPLSVEDIEAIEAVVNGEISAADSVTWREMSIDAARDSGAMMLFGEKYGDNVRMVEIGDGWSRELCGGTHVQDTARIRTFVIVGESSVGANTRRIEALTGDGAIAYLRSGAEAGMAAAREAGVPIDRLPEKTAEMSRRLRSLERELSSLKSGSMFDEAAAAATAVGDITSVVWRADGLDANQMLELADRLKQKLAPAVVLLGGATDGKVQLVASATDDAIAAGAHAGDLIGAVAAVVGGGGGGRPAMARAGGRDVSKIDEALKKGSDLIAEQVLAART